MKNTNRRAWLAFTSSALLGACGGGGGDNALTSIAVTLSGPSSGIFNIASTNFTVGANGPIGANIVVTPSSGSGGGTFTPTTVTLTTGAPTATFTYTPTTTGAKTISVTNNQGLTNPASIAYTATASFTNPTFTNLASGAGTGGTSSVTTPSVTLTANRLCLLTISSTTAGGNIPTCAGWTLVTTVQMGGLSRLTVLRRMVTSDLTQTHTYSFAGQIQSFHKWAISQSSANVDTTGTNGSGAVVQSATNGFVEVPPVNNGRYVSVTLAAFASAANSTFAVFGGSTASATPTPGDGFTTLATPGVGSFEYALITEYKAANDTVADASWSAPYDLWMGVAVEVAAGN